MRPWMPYRRNASQISGGLDAVVGGGEIHEAAVEGLLLAARAVNAPVDDVLQREEVVLDGQLRPEARLGGSA